MTKISVLICAVAGLLSAGCSNIERSRNLADPQVPAKTIAQQVCSFCHGIDGNSESPNFPRLAGQQAVYLANQLKNFRSHQRADPAGYEYMWGLSRYLTDEQITGLADYFSKQVPRAARVPSPDPALMAAGKAIFEQGVPEQNVIPCVACHGEKATGMEAFPRLASQHADYLIKQLDVFQYTQGRPGTPMETVVHPLTGSNKAAVAAYLQAFPQ